MKKVILFLFPFLIFTFLSVPVKASDYYYAEPTIYRTTELNQMAIDTWESYTNSQKRALLEEYFPIILKQLGVNNTTVFHYKDVQASYDRRLGAYKTRYNNDVDAFWNGTGLSFRERQLFVNTTHSRWYEDFADFLIDHIALRNKSLNLDRNGSDGASNVLQFYMNDFVGDMGVVTRTIFSYRNFSAVSFNNNSTVTHSFYNLCSNNIDKRFVIVAKRPGYSGGVNNWNGYVVFVPKESKLNIFVNGSVSDDVETNIELVDKDGISKMNVSDFDVYYAVQTSNDAFANFSTVCPSSFASQLVPNNGFSLGGASNLSGFNSNWELRSSGSVYNKSQFTILTLNSNQTNYDLFTSLSGYINHNGDFVNPFNTAPYFGSVPSVTIGAPDVTLYFNMTFNNDSSGGSGGSGGSGSDGSDDGFFDGLFDGLGSLVKSFFKGIADLFGSIAEGLGNILESITSIIGNLIDNFTSEDGSIFGFLKAFMVWLPDPLPSLLTTFFVLAVIFGVIKLIKGAFF